MTILGTDKAKYKKHITHFFLLVVAVSVAVIVLNVLLAVFRTDATHTAFIIINIIADIAAAWGVYALLTVKLLPMKKLINLYERGERNGKAQIGTVTEISDKTLCVQGFQCFKVTLNADGNTVELFLIENGISVETGKSYNLFTVENLIYKAEETV